MKTRPRNVFIIIIGCLFMIQPILLQYFEIINYLDEFVAIIMLLFYIKSLMHAKKIEKIEFKIITIMILIFGIGIMGNIINKYQLNRLPILWDAFNVFKVFFTLLGSMHFINQNCDKKKIISFLASYIRLIIFCGIMCWFITLFKDIGMNVSEVRYGIKSYNFIFINAGLFAMYLNLYLFILTIDLKNNSNSKKRIIFIVLTMFLMLTTLRTRSLAFILIYSFLLIKITFLKKFKLKWYHFILGIVCIFLIGYDSIEMYFGNARTARSAFATTSIKIMKQYFPIGTGFSTFGTDMAFRYYSPVYYRYGLNRIFGLSPIDGSFAHDTYWPAIIGQFGIIGTFLFIILLYYIFKIIYRNFIKNQYKNYYNYLNYIFLLSITVISSLATAVFFHFSTVGLFFLVPLMSKEKKDDYI